MSLTSRLKTDNQLKQWLHTHLPLGTVCTQLDLHNSQMRSQKKLVRPLGKINYLLGGMAFTYAFRWWLFGSLYKWLPDTVAWKGFSGEKSRQFFMDHFSEPSALGAIYLALMDKSWRRNEDVYYPEYGLESLSELYPYMEATVLDVKNLLDTIDSTFAHERYAPIYSQPVMVNPSFSGSWLVGGADAQLILSGILMDIRTTIRPEPATLTNFYQQICYFLLDLEDEYGIDYFSWYYSRQRACFMYPVNLFVPDAKRLRSEFFEFLAQDNPVPVVDMSYGILP